MASPSETSRRFPSLSDVGNLFMVGFNGTVFSPELEDFVGDLNPCGVILFARNIEDPLQLARLTRRIQRYVIERASHAVFIGLDQEGGRVTRLKGPFTAFPPALELARSEGPENAVRRFAEITAREMRLVGCNLDFVPVLDVLSAAAAPADSVIGDRSFGFDPRVVSALGQVLIETMRSNYVIPCCKHFPGHGGTAVDSHHNLPVDRRNYEALGASDLIPFRTAISLGVEMMMTAHIVYPALDPEYPATLSPRVIQEVLREDLQYEGVVITDDLDMAAVSIRYTIAESALRAFAAGIDIPLVCNSPEKAFAARDAIYGALKSGEIPVERFHQSITRIRALKSKYSDALRPCDESAVRAYFGLPYTKSAALLDETTKGATGMSELTHFDDKGRAIMVDVGSKEVTIREAVARGCVLMAPDTLKLILEGKAKKGDVLGVARIAGIMAAKKTPELVPLAHPLPLSSVKVEFFPDTERSMVEIEATVKVAARTGVEMEALTAVAVAALTIYDMCKAVDRGMVVSDIRLMEKSGGRSGHFKRE